MDLPDIANNNIQVNILLVDDREENLYSLQSLLGKSGGNVNFLFATSGNEALKIAYKTDLALILLDVQMPEMDGYEVATILKQKKNTQNVPIIFVTALNHESRYVVEGYSRGAVDYLFKPLDPVITKSKVDAFISIYQQQKKLERAYRDLEKIVDERTADLKIKNERLQKVNTALDQFVYMASHDLKLPLANLEALIHALKEELGSHIEDHQDLLDMINRSTVQMHETVNGLIGIIKSQQTDEKDIEEVNCQEVLEEVKLSISEMIKKTEAHIAADFSSCRSFQFNRASFKSILYNLITNSIKYKHPDRPPHINIIMKEQQETKMLCVKDNGMGMSTKEQERLFQIFSRIHEDEHTEGTGLGLYNLKKILEKYQASIEVLSQEGIGTEFKISFVKEIHPALVAG